MLHKRFLLISFIIISMLVVSACSMGAPKTVKVVASLALGLDFGVDVLNAAQLALDNAGGKAGDVTVELVVFDVSDPNGSPMSAEFDLRNANAAVEALKMNTKRSFRQLGILSRQLMQRMFALGLVALLVIGVYGSGNTDVPTSVKVVMSMPSDLGFTKSMIDAANLIGYPFT